MIEPFELYMLGGATEKRYRRMRPEVEKLPWGTLDPSKYPVDLVRAAAKSWTLAAYQEHRTGAACAEALGALVTARAPLDLIAVASRFPLDELAHVEMCSRLATELGGGVTLEHDPLSLIPIPSRDMPPLLRAADCVVRYFCIGEALSIPLLHGAYRVAKHPLVKGVLGQIVRDEAAHGFFGWTFLDWAESELTEACRIHLADVATVTIDALTSSWDERPDQPAQPEQPDSLDDLHTLGWMETDAYYALAESSLHKHVLEPLRARGIDPKPAPWRPVAPMATSQ